jgi:hypothetical protein
MRIRDAELPTINSVEEFIKEWLKQGGSVISNEPNWLVIQNSEGQKFECAVLGDLIAPFDFS